MKSCKKIEIIFYTDLYRIHILDLRYYVNQNNLMNAMYTYLYNNYMYIKYVVISLSFKISEYI